MDDNNLLACEDFLRFFALESAAKEHDRNDEQDGGKKFVKYVVVPQIRQIWLVLVAAMRKHATCPGCDLNNKVRIGRINDPSNSLLLFLYIGLFIL